MDQISRVWFADNRIYILTSDGSEKSRPLEAFPRLKDASDVQRNSFVVWDDGHSIRWEEIDEDIHVSSFDDSIEPNFDNDVANMLDAVGCLDLTAFAEMVGISKTKLDLFRYGIWTPSDKTMQKIREGLRQIECRIAAVL